MFVYLKSIHVWSWIAPPIFVLKRIFVEWLHSPLLLLLPRLGDSNLLYSICGTYQNFRDLNFVFRKCPIKMIDFTSLNSFRGKTWIFSWINMIFWFHPAFGHGTSEPKEVGLAEEAWTRAFGDMPRRTRSERCHLDGQKNTSWIWEPWVRGSWDSLEGVLGLVVRAIKKKSFGNLVWEVSASGQAVFGSLQFFQVSRTDIGLFF